MITTFQQHILQQQVPGASGNFSTVGTPMSPNSCYPSCRSATITVDDLHYSNVWLPDVGTVQSIDFTGKNSVTQRDDLRYNTATDNAVLTSGLASGDSYSMRVEIPSLPPPNQMKTTLVAQVAQPISANVPPAAQQKAQALTARAPTAFGKAQLLEQTLRRTGAYSDGAS